MRLAVFTVCSNQSVSQAQVLLQTVDRFLPEADRFLILADEPHPAVPYPDGCMVIPARDIGIPDFAGFAFRYDHTELSAAVKPFAFLYLLGKRGYTHCLYFDPDIELFSTIPAVRSALGANASFILTPHILAPAEQDRGPDDVTIMRAGVYNLGFLGVSGTPEARDLLAWWARWLRWQCVNDQPIGLFIDQKFMDLMPGFASGIRILHDPGLNVAYWNLSQRRFVPDAPGGPQVDGGDLGFFHYSGFDASRPDQLSTETDQFRDGALPAAWRAFLAGYAGRLRTAGHGKIPAGSYAYGRFASGVPIPEIARRMFRDDHDAWAGDPFETFEAWTHLPAREAVLSLGSAIPSLIMQWLQARHPALVRFPLRETAGAEQVTRWWLENGASIGIDRRFLEPQALAAGLRPVSVRASCPAPQPGRADVTVIAPFGEDSPSGQAGQAASGSLRRAAGQVEELDVLAGDSPPVSGRLLAFCLPPDKLAPVFDVVKFRLPGRAYRVFIPSAERIVLSPTCLDALGQIDEVWAPTRFIQALMVLATELPVLHMPVAWRFPAMAAAGGFVPPDRPYILAASDSFPGSGELLAAVQAYDAAFGSQPPTSRPALMIHSQATDAWDDELHAAIAATGGVIVSSLSDVTALVAGAACVLSLHRGDALGLSVLRAMACGVPVVATDYGGCTDLLSPESGFPVDFRLVHTATAEVDLAHAAWSLRDVFGRPDMARRRAANARQLVETTHNPAAVAARQAGRMGMLGLIATRTRTTVPV
jgi:glycosyltransferase involved in cell wall biosynthesis